VLDQIPPLRGIVDNRNDVGLAEGEAADVLVEVDELLERHAVRPVMSYAAINSRASWTL
jgi:hypothetical protein